MDKAVLISMLVSFVTTYPDQAVVVEQQQVPQAGTDFREPAFCNGIKCPVYKLLNKTKDYELRLYPKTSWMSTRLEGISYKEASYTMFMRLFRYISRGNKQDKKIPMTCPVINKITPGPSATCKSDFIMSFYNDPAEGAPPAPNDKTVFVSKFDKVQVYVRSFGGFAEYEDFRDNGLKLGEALEQDGLGDTYVTNFYYTAGYDAPYKLFNRHNEVWFMKKMK